MAYERPTMTFWEGIRKQVILLAVLALVLAGLSAISSGGKATLVSPEIKFTDASRSGLAIVPASCPSDPHYVGECDLVCGTGYILQNGICVPSCGTGYILQNGVCVPSCGTGYILQNGVCIPDPSLLCGAGFIPQNGICIPTPSPQFDPFTGSGPNDTFTATGHLQVRPSLLRSGDTTRVYWRASYVTACTVVGTNGDNWTGIFSGAAGKVTSSITGNTQYTLSCTALPDTTPVSISETVTVYIVPVFQEK